MSPFHIVLLSFALTGIYVAVTLPIAVRMGVLVHKRWASVFIVLGSLSGATLALA